MNATNIYKEDFLDILFEGRNKEYGAYDLRRSEDRRVRNAIIGTASIALVVIGGYVCSNKLMATDMGTRKAPAPVITVLKNLHTEPENTPPPPTPPASTPPPAASSIRSVTPTIARDELVRPEDEVPKMDSIGNKKIGFTTSPGDDVNGSDNDIAMLGGTGTSNVVEAPKGEDREIIRTFVEINPDFPGGQDALGKFLHDNVHYPRVAQENGIDGKVFVQFVVDWEGNIRDVKTVGAVKGGGLEEEAIRVVKKMPKWKPGKQNGQAVSVQFSLPISFTLM